MKWAVFKDAGAVHVVPISDDGDTQADIIDDHALVEGCWCGPTVEVHARLLVVHNAFEN